MKNPSIEKSDFIRFMDVDGEVQRINRRVGISIPFAIWGFLILALKFIGWLHEGIDLEKWT